MFEQTVKVFNVHSVRDLKAKVAAAKFLFNTERVDVVAAGTFIEARTGNLVFCRNSPSLVKHFGYTHLRIEGDALKRNVTISLNPAEPNIFTLFIHLD